MNWNTPYAANRDYSQLSTANLQRLLDLVGGPVFMQENGQPSSLDIGCGTGQLVRDLYHRGFRSCGIDISEIAVQIARRSSLYIDETAFIQGDVLKSHFDRTFNLITCKYVYVFIAQKDAFLKRIQALLASGGVFVVISPDPAYLPDSKQSIAVDSSTLLGTLSAYFNYVEESRINDDFVFICKIL